MKHTIENIERKKCMGCKMCGDICPANAITYIKDSEGFWYPTINHKLCNNCGKCFSRCPEINVLYPQNAYIKVYAAWNNNDKIRMKSTSGGLFHAFASAILEKNGVVCGCTYDKDYRGAHHRIVTTKEELDSIIGTKYLQSDSAMIYQSIEKYLKEGTTVLFCGTPCQCAALYNYLSKPYENLFLIDLICHGVNSPKVFEKFLDDLEKRYASKVKSVHFRNKKTGWQNSTTYIEFENGRFYRAGNKTDLWMIGYISEHLYMRPSCHQCTHRGNHRSSDISIGDFWGIKGAKNDDMFKGISALMINSPKGQELLDMLEGQLYLKEKMLQDVAKGNPMYYISSKQGAKREKFFIELDKNTFSTAMKKVLGNDEKYKNIIYLNKASFDISGSIANLVHLLNKNCHWKPRMENLKKLLYKFELLYQGGIRGLNMAVKWFKHRIYSLYKTK